MSQPSPLQKLKSSSALSHNTAQRQILDALIGNDTARENLVSSVIGRQANDNNRWQDVKAGKEPLSVEELASILREMEAQGKTFITDKKDPSPIAQQAFYDSLAKSITQSEDLKKQLEGLREESKKQKGFLSKVFGVFSHPKPIEKVLADISVFDKYCRDNGITYDEVKKQLVAGAKPKTGWDKVKDFRFLVAAASGGALGLAGLNAMGMLPALAVIPTVFFGALPYIALPFIGLSVFKAFSEKSILQEFGTFWRFGVTTAAGFAIGIGVTSLMSGFLVPVDPATVGKASEGVMSALAGGPSSFNPMAYILETLAVFATLGTVYRRAKEKTAEGFARAADATTTGIKKLFNTASDVFINKVTSSAIITSGDFLKKLSTWNEKTFGHFMNYVGLPAVFLMLGGAMSDGGLGKLATYGGYYLTVFTGLFAGLAATCAAYYAYGCRGKEFRSISNAAGTAFGTSSSAATTFASSQSLREMGVPDKIVNSVIPLGANFNMLGTSLYLGTTAHCAIIMFGHDPSLTQQVGVAATAFVTAFGAPGMPASNLALMQPTLQKIGLSADQAARIYEMVLPMDRILDMCQTVLNVLGDMIVAVDLNEKEKRLAAKAAKKLPKTPAAV